MSDSPRRGHIVEQICNLVVVGALAMSIPMLEIRSPIVGEQLGLSLQLVLLTITVGLALGGCIGWLLRHESRRLSPRFALLAGVVWLGVLAIDNDAARIAGIVGGIVGSTAACLLTVVELDALSSRRYAGLAPITAFSVGLIGGLGYLAGDSSRDWKPVLGVAGSVAIVASAICLIARQRQRGRSRRRALPAGNDPAGRWRDGVAITHLAIAAAIGSTWGAIPAVSRIIWQQFQASERSALVCVLLGGCAATVTGWVMQRRALSQDTHVPPAATLVPVSGLALLCVAISIGERWTLAWWVVALASGGALLAMSTSTESAANDVSVAATRRREIPLSESWASAAVGMVIGLAMTAATVVGDSIDPRFAVGVLCIPSVVLSVVLGGRGRTGGNRSLKTPDSPPPSIT
jgi:hypothetical protein